MRDRRSRRGWRRTICERPWGATLTLPPRPWVSLAHRRLQRTYHQTLSGPPPPRSWIRSHLCQSFLCRSPRPVRVMGRRLRQGRSLSRPLRRYGFWQNCRRSRSRRCRLHFCRLSHRQGVRIPRLGSTILVPASPLPLPCCALQQKVRCRKHSQRKHCWPRIISARLCLARADGGMTCPTTYTLHCYLLVNSFADFVFAFTTSMGSLIF